MKCEFIILNEIERDKQNHRPAVYQKPIIYNNSPKIKKYKIIKAYKKCIIMQNKYTYYE